MSKFSYEISTVTSSVHGIQLPVQSMEFSYQFSPWNSVTNSVHGIQFTVTSSVMHLVDGFQHSIYTQIFSYQCY